jgi:hypothetical protein
MGDTFEKRKREQRKRMKRKEKLGRRRDRVVLKQEAVDRGEEMIETLSLEEAIGEPIYSDPEAVVDFDDDSADARARRGRL